MGGGVETGELKDEDDMKRNRVLLLKSGALNRH